MLFSVNRPLGLDAVLSSVIGQEQHRTVKTSRVISTVVVQAAPTLPYLSAGCFNFHLFALHLSVCRMACWTGTSSWHGSLSALRRYGQEKMNFWKCSFLCCCGWEIHSQLALLTSALVIPFLLLAKGIMRGFFYQEHQGVFLWVSFLAHARMSL